jgi:hypothetical protein
MARIRREKFDHDTNTLYVQETEDVESVLEDNAEERNSGRNGFSVERSFRKIGSIPLIMLDDAFRKGINPFNGSPEGQKWIREFLQNNPKLMTVDRLKTAKRHIIQ